MISTHRKDLATESIADAAQRLLAELEARKRTTGAEKPVKIFDPANQNQLPGKAAEGRVTVGPSAAATTSAKGEETRWVRE